MSEQNEVQKLKNLPVKQEIHAVIKDYAKKKGMNIQGLTERILKKWMDEKFLI